MHDSTLMISVGEFLFEVIQLTHVRIALVSAYLQPESTDNTHTGSQATVRLASQWGFKCTSTHTRCRGYDNMLPPLPTRVIDVGASSTSPFLYTSKGSHASYIALSHCWGKARIITTTRDNIEQHSKEIPMTALSKTFQDAVIFTRELGVRFLWIDSLCILQDSRHDWEIESSAMHDYYKNAYLTIAATYALDGSVGCFQPRNPLTIQPCRVKFRFPPQNLGPDPTKEEYDFVCVQFSPHQLSFHESEWKTPALDHRAWCMQEAILSTRTLKFDKATVRWICNE